MQNTLKAIRHLVFAIFIICSAIIASISVWNFSISKALRQELQIDAYLTFVGAFGLAYIFIIICLELGGKSAITGQVWFECTWIGIFWVMELAGASALSALGPNVMCASSNGVLILNACSSTQVLLAFSWICTIVLFGYFLLLLLSSISCYKDNPSIWRCQVHQFPWRDCRQCLSSAPPSPAKFQHGKIEASPSILAPKPRRAVPSNLYSGLSPEYQVEHYRPPSSFAQPAPPAAAMQRPIRRPTMVMQSTSMQHGAPSFYPQYIQAASFATPAPSAESQRSQDIPPPPPPLGNWPRADIMSQPFSSRFARDLPPTSVTTAQAPVAGTSPRDSSNTLPRARPSGPRRRSSSNGDNRPPPLDLSNVSSYRAVNGSYP